LRIARLPRRCGPPRRIPPGAVAPGAVPFGTVAHSAGQGLAPGATALKRTDGGTAPATRTDGQRHRPRYPDLRRKFRIHDTSAAVGKSPSPSPSPASGYRPLAAAGGRPVQAVAGTPGRTPCTGSVFLSLPQQVAIPAFRCVNFPPAPMAFSGTFCIGNSRKALPKCQRINHWLATLAFGKSGAK
jgi:hypothetical protein